MKQYILRRCGYSLVSLFLLSLVIFLLALRLWQDGPPEIVTRKAAPSKTRASVTTASAMTAAVPPSAQRATTGQRPPRRRRR